MTNIDDIRAHLLGTAANIGMEQRAALSKAEAKLTQTKAKLAEWHDKTKDASEAADDSNSGGFATLRFQGMAAMGKAFGEAGLNDPTGEQAVSISEAMVVSFMASFTASTAKTKAGGTEAGVARFIRTGSAAPRLLAALQQRLSHWQAIRDSANESEDASEAKAIRDSADRYLKLADSDKLDKATGKVVRPKKWKGRPGAQIGNIVIPAGSGANRTSQLAQIAALYHQHGDEVMRDDVLDALLDNGGLADKPEPGIAEFASKAHEALTKLFKDYGGENTADGLALSMILPVLQRISHNGEFASNTQAAPTPSGVASYVVRADEPEDVPVASLGIPDAEQQDVPAPHAPAAEPDAIDAALALPEAGEDDGDMFTEEAPGQPVAPTPPPVPNKGRGPSKPRTAAPPKPRASRQVGL